MKKMIFGAIALATLAACSAERTVEAFDGPGYDLSARHGKASGSTDMGGDWADPRYNTPQYERNLGGDEKVGAKPSADYVGQYWMDPETQCTYSRAGRPSEVRWTLVLNPIGAPAAKSHCQRTFITVPYSGPSKWKRVGKNTFTTTQSIMVAQ